MPARTAGAARHSTALVLWLAAGLCAWPAPANPAEEISPPVTVDAPASATFGSALPSIPPEFDSIAPLLDRVVGVVQSLVEAQAELKRLRTEVDGLKTKLSAADSELALVDKEHQQVSVQLSAAERGKEDRLQALRKELEAKLSSELAAARAQVAQETQREFDQELQVFEGRQEALVGKTLDSEQVLKERELAQLTEEINVQTQELLDRLARLEANSELAKSLERSTNQALAKRRQELDARRAQLATARRDTLARQRSELVQQLTQQRDAEIQRRVTFKEASQRSAMAELLRKSEREEQSKIDRIRQAADQVTERRNKLVQQEALLRARTEDMDRQLAAKSQGRERLEADRREALAHLEDGLAKTGQSAAHPVALAWLGRAIRYLPAPAASEIIPMQQRLVAAAEQEERLQEQRRMVREREQALQLSRELEKQHRKVQEQQQREQQVRARNADELLAKADRLAAKGQFDQALELVAQAQAINPPQLDRIAMVREQLVATKNQRQRQEQAAGLESLFQRAKTAFDAGRYEEAVVLFEQVIAQEAASGRSPSPAARLMAEGAARGAVQ